MADTETDDPPRATTGRMPTPAQSATIAQATRAMAASELVIVTGEPGSGRSFVLHELQRRCGGRVLTVTDLMALTNGRNARRYEQCLYELLRGAFAEHRIVYFDDVDGFQGADGQPGYNRRGLISTVLRIVRDLAATEDKRLVVTTRYLDLGARGNSIGSGASWDDKGVVVRIAAFSASDYAHVLGAHLGPTALETLDVDRLFAGSRRLTAKMLVLLARIIAERGLRRPTAEDALAIVDREILHGVIDLAEIEPVSMHALVGVEEIASRIDRAILLPLNEPALARELGLEPKRGILLHGPPGTGKTTIGRALAHMMRGKFFIIDGDFVHDGPGFQAMVDAVFDAAVRHSPAVIFVDDADVIMNDPDMQHFGRYLLTKLDGLQSESLANVCVIMTAMNIASMPAALLRSGRLEVWLEMTLPDADARAALIRSYAERLPFAAAAQAVRDSVDALAQTTQGFTPADLRRLVGDATGRLAFDRHRQRAEQSFEHYLMAAADELRAQKGLAETAIASRGGLRFY